MTEKDRSKILEIKTIKAVVNDTAESTVSVEELEENSAVIYRIPDDKGRILLPDFLLNKETNQTFIVSLFLDPFKGIKNNHMLIVYDEENLKKLSDEEKKYFLDRKLGKSIPVLQKRIGLNVQLKYIGWDAKKMVELNQSIKTMEKRHQISIKPDDDRFFILPYKFKINPGSLDELKKIKEKIIEEEMARKTKLIKMIIDSL